MSRKDYRALAEALKGASADRQICMAVGIVCKHDNPRFDMETFLEACGVAA
jgi:hypothetical protein